MPIVFTLKKTLNELGITKNKLAVESKIRPATIADIVNGKSKRIELDTLLNILDTLNQFAKEKGIDQEIKVEDVFIYTKKSSQ